MNNIYEINQNADPLTIVKSADYDISFNDYEKKIMRDNKHYNSVFTYKESELLKIEKCPCCEKDMYYFSVPDNKVTRKLSKKHDAELLARVYSEDEVTIHSIPQ